MSTKHSPLRVLKAQSDSIAKDLKAWSRGERVKSEIELRLLKARAEGANGIKIGLVMDDKVLTFNMTWATIESTSEVGIAEWILRQMRESRDTVQ